MNAVTVLTQISQQTAAALPAVLGAVQTVEAVAPEHATGQEKAAAAIAAASGELVRTAPANVASVAMLVNISVSVLNAFGLFSRRAKQQ